MAGRGSLVGALPYGNANQIEREMGTQLIDATINSVGWIGSSYFLNTGGYYDYYTSTSPHSQWSYRESRDSGYPDVGRGGYLTCKEWWSTSGTGLKSRLARAYNTKVASRMKFVDGGNWEKNLLSWLVSPQNTLMSAGKETYMAGSQRGARDRNEDRKRFTRLYCSTISP